MNNDDNDVLGSALDLDFGIGSRGPVQWVAFAPAPEPRQKAIERCGMS